MTPSNYGRDRAQPITPLSTGLRPQPVARDLSAVPQVVARPARNPLLRAGHVDRFVPAGESFEYVTGGWPHDRIRAIHEEEGGAMVRYQLEQIRSFVDRRKERGVSQANFARMTGLRANTISELESGKSFPDWHTLARLAYALEADVRFVGRQAVRVEDVEPRR